MGTLLRESSAPVPSSVLYLLGNGALYLPNSVSVPVILHTSGKVSFSRRPVYEVVAPFIITYTALILGKHPCYKGLRRIGVFSQGHPAPVLKENRPLGLIALDRVFPSYDPVACTKNLFNKRWGKPVLPRRRPLEYPVLKCSCMNWPSTQSGSHYFRLPKAPAGALHIRPGAGGAAPRLK